MPRFFSSPAARRQLGVSLLEVLIAVLVLAAGVLGAAQLQLAALRYNAGAAHATQASFIAYDMLDRLRANADDIEDYAGLSVSGCSDPQPATELGAQDRRDFAAAVGCQLPKGAGSIVVAGNQATVTVGWSEARIAPDEPDTQLVISTRLGAGP
ncbi:type IV pilus assembly protein PilV [Halopseudomonas xinjiangensis]|uniref:Type IV pilus assembly protein PilV n=1 Tax=Halopseudomonas xinjiangensis TaxID=487184 RepID=A0A1H1VZX7_9GAMM|nr:type IV pilus modification protein PilV [Halopseudomonas xinjiangensis]SDS89796.1 type IV pilus assembly protein PilV [Halopseudomonas xinjiangensis]